METMQDLAASALKDNPYFSAGAGLFGVGIGMAALRRISQVVNLLVRRNFTLTLEVASHDKAYPWVLHWITMKSSGSLIKGGKNSIGGASQHLSVETSVVRTEGGRIKAAFGFVPSVGVHYMFYQMKLIRIERVRAQQSLQGASMAPFESVTLTTFGRDARFFIDLLEEAREKAVARDKGWTVVYKAVGSEWRQFGYPRPRRPLDSVILREGVAEAIVADVKEFVDNQSWYTDRGIPYHRGYLLHGPPGCGKTSFITALAGHLDYSISILNLSEFGMTADRLDHLLTHAPLQTIILLEDIDAAVHNRDKPNNDLLHRKAYEGMPTLTLSGLLNALDGVTSTDGRIIFMTTNYIDRLDPALIRPGRVDMRILVDVCDSSQLTRMFSRFYPQWTSSDINDLAQKFASLLKDTRLSSAQVQGYLLLYKDDPLKAISNINQLTSPCDP
ncbi:Mitochondrial chaperone BCS1 [Schistosoma japonicum]|uniref:Mitochondrial chaperone BCS1 n=3 Tax=Schistosoma japonicum TaxID=6182 RepID=A0A4Z2D057_SCHJA|nr:Mitochondrial chaperone BCS1 [Schistosoma japonicum]TNN09844.1 Mitochondrial chaperone BCS1 [Schistosoma japonicum]